MLRIRNIYALIFLINFTSIYASLPVLVDSVSAHSRAYSFSFGNGNLAANWSFEDPNYFWSIDGSTSAITRKSDLEAVCGASCAPITGTYALWITPTEYHEEVISEAFDIEPGQEYSLSLYAWSLGLDRVSPVVVFFSDAKTVSKVILGHQYTNEGRWVLHSDRFVAPNDARFAMIILGKRVGNATGNLVLDDVLFEKGHKPSDRSSIAVSVSFGDGLGRTHQSQVMLDRQWSSELIPSECLEGYTIYGTTYATVGSRAQISSGNIGSGDSLYIDNDVVLPSPSGGYITLRSTRGLRLGDRVKVNGELRYGSVLQLGSQVSFTGLNEKETASTACVLGPKILPETGSDVYVNNDQNYSLTPGLYGNAMIRARSTVTLSAGDYYFKSFHLEPQAILNFNLSEGHIRIHVKDELRIDDNTRFEFDTNGTNFISWYSAQKANLRLGTISNLAGVFILPNARVELGHQSTLHGLLYAKEVNAMADSKIRPPSFLFHVPKATWAIASTEFDDFGRIDKSAMPFVAEKSVEGIVQAPFDHAINYYSPTGDGADAKGYPFSEVQYSRMYGTVDENSIPGFDWRIGSDHTAKNGWFYVDNLDVPASLAAYKNEGEEYILSWSRDAENRFNLMWKNRLDQLVQTATAPSGTDSDMRLWKWNFTQYEYSPEGRLIKTKTPLDVQNNSASFAEIINYDAQGRIVAKSGPDRGLVKYWYDHTGLLRYMQTESQRIRGAYTFAEYDAQGRKTISGETILGALSDEVVWMLAEDGDPASGSRTIYGGNAYDKHRNCLDAIAIEALDSLFSSVNAGNSRGRKVCSWSRNSHAVSLLGAERSLVADFYGYDLQGRLVKTYRYTGSLGNTEERLRLIEYKYDDLDRIASVLYQSGKGHQLSRSDYHYDTKGRISSITGADSLNVVSFRYDKMGKLLGASLGNDVDISYTYHLHGQIKSIEAKRTSTGVILYRQYLGYEDTVAEGIAQPRYDGLITQNLTRFAEDVAQSPERLADYSYDGWGRLIGKNGTDGSFAMNYDANGRITSQINGSEQLIYTYNLDSYRLDHVAGSSPLAPSRDMSMEGNFQWDVDGRMIYDASRDLLIDYDATGLPIEFRRQEQTDSLGKRTIVQTQLYGPDGVRTATFDWVDSANVRLLVGSRSDVVLGGHKRSEIREMYNAEGALLSTNEYTMIQGQSNVVGRNRPDGLNEWYVKDYQGSLALTIVGNGYGSSFAYHPYGAQNLVRTDGQPPSEQYTGKEWSGTYEFYYYGARFLDPVLGMWSVPDPAGQFANPYAFGGNPINYTDPDGEFVIAAMVVGAIIGAYMGASSANDSYIPWKWSNNWNTWGNAAKGGVVGAIVGGVGAAAGGVAAGLQGGIGVSAMEMGLATGITAGAVSGATGYTANTLMNGKTWYGDQMMGSATTGAFSGAAGGVTGAYFGAGEYNINLLGNAGASFMSGGVSSGVGEMMAGGSFWRGFGVGGLSSLAGTYMSYGASRIQGPAPGTFDGTDLTQSGAQKGDIVAFGRDGTAISEIIADFSAGDYSHIGVIDGDESGLFVREATGDGSNLRTKLSDYSNRPYKIISRGNSITAGGYDYTGLAILNTLAGSESSGYAFTYRNCTTQAARWTGYGFMNNPNVMANNMLGISPYYNRYSY